MATPSRRILLGVVDRIVYDSANYWVAMLSDLAAALAWLALGLNRFSGPREAECWDMTRFYSEFVALDSQVRFIQYDRIALQMQSSVAGSCVGWNVPNTRSQIVVLMPKFTTGRA